MSSQVNKTELRRHLLQKRRSLPQKIWQQKSQQICQNLQHFPQFQQAKTILAYFSFRQEPDLSPLFEIPCQWGFSRCGDRYLSWHQWQPANPLKKGIYGIPEPFPDAPILPPETVDLILVPAVACDRFGYRLGYGGGFYDRMLSETSWKNIPKIGIIFDFAYVSQLPRESWDQVLDAVCTESGVKLT